MAKTYNVAVIGSTGRGDYGHGLDTAWTKVERIRIVAVADDNPQGLAKAGEKLQVASTARYRDYRKMLAEVLPDIVAICPRWLDQHCDMVLAAAEHGAHIYMEKPFCRTLEEADRMVEACERAHVKLAVAHPTSYSPRLQTIKQMIADGAIGRVLEYRGRGKEDHRGGGEDLWVLGSHIMDMIIAIGDVPKWCFAQVTAAGHPVGKQDVKEGNEGIGPLAGDAVQAMYGMPDGSTAYFSSYRKAAGDPSRFALQIFGEKGIFEIREGTMPPVKFRADSGWAPGRGDVAWQDVSTAGAGKEEPITDSRYNDRHWLAITDLLDAIETDRQPLCGVYRARSVVEMICAVFESHRLGGKVDLPLTTRVNPLTKL